MDPGVGLAIGAEMAAHVKLSLLLGLGAALALMSLVFLLLKETRRLALVPGIALLLLGIYVAVWSQRRFILPAGLIAAASIPVIVLSLTFRRTP